MGRAALVLGAMWLVGCEMLAKPEAYVGCQASDLGFACSLEHRAGSSALKACWDVVITCKNGAKPTARGCQTAEPKGRSTLFIPQDSFSDMESCDQPLAANVTNMTLE